MNDKTDNLENNPEPSQPDPSEDMTPSPEQEMAEDLTSSLEQEPVVEGDSPDHENVPALENLEEKPAWMEEASPGSKSSSLFIPLLLVLVLGTVGGGGYWIYGEQKKLHLEVEAGFNQITSRLNTLEADLQGLQKSQQRVEASSQSIEAYKSEVAQTFQAQQNSLSTLDEDVLRLKESLNHLAQRQSALSTSAVTSPPENTQPVGNEDANIVREKLLPLFWELGVRRVSLGIESGSEEILKTMGKRTDRKVIEESTSLLHSYGFRVDGLFILGHRGETPETMRQTLDFAQSLRLSRAWFSHMVPFPGTPVWDEGVEKYGRIVNDEGSAGHVRADRCFKALSGPRRPNYCTFRGIPSIGSIKALFWAR